MKIPIDEKEKGAVETEVETLGEWCQVASQFDFENVGFSREHKAFCEGKKRLLSCATCERGILGVAIPSGSGPDIKMFSYIAIDRVNWE